MDNLFELDGNYNVTINPILLSIKEFEKIWKRDRSKSKMKALKQLTYIYAMCSSNEDNIWKEYTNMSDRSKIIISDLWGDELAWSPDRLVTEAIEKYKARIPQTPTELLLETLMQSMMDIRDFIKEIDYNDVDNQGRLIHNPKNTLDIAKKALDRYMEIEEAIEKIRAKKKLASDKIKGGGEEGFFEDTESLSKLTE